MFDDALQVIGKLGSRGITLLAFAGQGFHDDRVQVTACQRTDARQPRRCVIAQDFQRFENRGRVQARIRQLSANQFIGDYAQRIHIAAHVDVRAVISHWRSPFDEPGMKRRGT